MARARSRKRRPGGDRGGRRAQQDGEQRAQTIDAPAQRAAARASAKPPAPRRPRTSPTAPTFGERPRAPWHPLPLSELLILVGLVGAAIGFRQGAAGGPSVLVGLLAVAIGTIEVTLREHRSGYRSHTVLLALLPVLVFDSLVVLAVSAFATPPRLLIVALIAIDVALFALLFRALRARFLEARHARVLKEG